MHKKRVSSMHPAAQFAIKYGVLCSFLPLLFGFFFPKASFYAISCCRAAVFCFAVSIIGGLLIDVIALRTGKRE